MKEESKELDNLSETRTSPNIANANIPHTSTEDQNNQAPPPVLATPSSYNHNSETCPDLCPRYIIEQFRALDHRLDQPFIIGLWYARNVNREEPTIPLQKRQNSAAETFAKHVTQHINKKRLSDSYTTVIICDAERLNKKEKLSTTLRIKYARKDTTMLMCIAKDDKITVTQNGNTTTSQRPWIPF